jgi:hypothetical protein
VPNNKKPRAATFADIRSDVKKPRIEENPTEYKDQTPHWCFKHVLLDGTYRWSGMEVEKVREDVYGSLRSYGTMLWKEIDKDHKKTSCHSLKVEDLSPKVRDAFRKQVRDADDAFQLSVSGKGRIYGVRQGRVLSIVLWDPEHEGFPTFKKGT